MFSKIQPLSVDNVNESEEEYEYEGSNGEVEVKLANVVSVQLSVRSSAMYRNDCLVSDDEDPDIFMFVSVSVEEWLTWNR